MTQKVAAQTPITTLSAAPLSCGSKSPSFLLYGSGFVYNYGCEAIIRGTVHLLRQQWPDGRIRYASVLCHADSARLAGCPVEVVPRVRKQCYFERFPLVSPWTLSRWLQYRFKIDHLPTFEHSEYLEDSDVVLSVGGDLYTPHPSGWGYPKDLVRFGDAVLARGKKLVVWGASIGPFKAKSQAEDAIAQHLRHVTLITAREQSTIAYLRRIGIEYNVVACADPAFALAGNGHRPNTTRSRPHIAVNLSPLSVAYSKVSIDDALNSHAEAIKALVDRIGADIVLAPHVRSYHFGSNDDYRYLCRLYSLLPDMVRRHVTILESDEGYLGAKQVFAECDLVIAARMHCAINALSECVPAILLAYSQKAYGLSEYVYGSTRWVLPVSQLQPQKLIATVESLLSSRAAIVAHLQARLPSIREDAKRAVTALLDLIATPRQPFVASASPER